MRIGKLSKENALKAIYEQRIIIKAIEKAEQSLLDTLDDRICQRYILIQNVSQVAEWLNENGERINGRKYVGKDIKELMSKSQSSLKGIALAFFNYNNTVANGSKNYSGTIRRLKECVDHEDLSSR